MALSKLIWKFFLSPPLLCSPWWRPGGAQGWVGLLFILLLSCDNDITGDTPDNPGDSEIRFEIGFAPTTRVSTDADLVSTWEEGDEIGIFAVKTPTGISPQLKAADNYLHNEKLTYLNGSWTSETTFYYPNDEERLCFYAYYPYDAALTNPTAYNFSVATDQSLANYNKSDFLLAKTGEVEKSDDPVLMSFEHQLSVVQIEILREVNMPHFDGDFTVTLTNVQTGIEIDLNKTAGEYDVQNTREDIRMHKVAGTRYLYRAVVPAQILAGNTKITFKQTDTGKEIDMEYTGLANKVLTAGKAHKYKITLSWYGIDPDHIYSVGDVYPHAGPVLGIVYEISNGGKNGKAVSLDEATGLAWSDHNTDHNSKDGSNGHKNMKDITDYINESNYNWLNFPAFNWVHEKNDMHETYSNDNITGVWYLPSINEGVALNNAYQDYGTSAFDSKLTGAGGTGLSMNWYWASTSRSANNANTWLMSIGTTSNATKTSTTYRARCILAF